MLNSKMEVAFVAMIAASLSLASCGNKSSQKPTEAAPAATEQTAADDASVTYACPMHPEVTGKKGDTCRICGMELEPVTKADAGDKKMEMK